MASNRNRQKRRGSDRKDITLMTILANEATAESRKLLKKYGKADAQSHADLEQKLAELYFNTSDKVQLEKEMAAIHPHRKWIEKYIEPKVEVVETKVEETSSADGCNCGCGFGASTCGATGLAAPAPTSICIPFPKTPPIMPKS